MSNTQYRPFKLAFSILAILVASAAVYVILGLGASIWRLNLHSLSDMDWNDDGATTLEELLDTLDIGQRAGRPGCIHFYAMKDGLDVKVVCRPETAI